MKASNTAKPAKQWAVVEYFAPHCFEIKRTIGFRAGVRITEHMKDKAGKRMRFPTRQAAQAAIADA